MHDDLPDPVAPAIQHVGHFGQIDHHRPTGDVASERHLEGMVGLGRLGRREDVAEGHQFAATVGDFDSDGRLPGIGARMRTSGEAMA